ncbi:hypothetical protein [Pseudalkalibacillus caeni]|uniref:Ethanolamine utilization protein n=1 Tax=Exobacillus caeni TaxID=2574798 RepID=A0A5R9F5C7_9BACL|nr:hypothetical protein [Pseudalkalibacillus caeni]TLS38942.1 hypothetical protein FCL54_01120 [Pseudalkalibacillus caeni]
MGNKKQSAMMEHTLQLLLNRNGSADQQQKPFVLALLTSHLIGMEPGFSYLKAIKDNAMLNVVLEEAVLEQYEKQEILRLTGAEKVQIDNEVQEIPFHKLDTVLLPVLSFSLVSDILALNEQRPLVRIILSALLAGKKVIALRAGADPFHPIWKMKGMDKGATALKGKLNKRLIELKSFGVILVDYQDKIDLKKENSKTLVTEETIRFAYQQGESVIFISKNTIVTPLAKDTAKELNIAIITE